MTNVDTSKVASEIKQQIADALSQLGKDASAVQIQMDQFLTAIEPDIDEAIASVDLLSLNLIRDRIASKLGSVSVGVIQQERILVLSVITSVLRTIVQIAIGALASA